jgi:FMN-dependent NADH-azoreductase
MSKVLHIESSPRGDRSASITVAQAFVEAYQSAHPHDEVETLDLWHASIPEFDGPTIQGKYAIMHQQAFTPEQDTAWKAVVKLADHFKSADKYIISLPMWNFGIPYKLKHYIDVLAQPGLTFSVSDKGYQGLVTGKPLVLIYARGGAYGPGSGAEGYDAQSSYMKQITGFLGFTNVKEIFVEPTMQKTDAVEKGKQHATELAGKF